MPIDGAIVRPLQSALEAIAALSQVPLPWTVPMAAISRRAFAAAACTCVSSLVAPAMAQSDDVLAAARKTFSAGVEDENAKRFAAALEEFQRVAAVRDTANVRYRIASCLEALGRRAEALTSYESAVRIGQSDASSADVLQESRERADQLDRVVAHLAIAFTPSPPPGVELRIDDVPVDPSMSGNDLRLDPGHHSIAASAPGTAPFRTGVTLVEGSRLRLAIDLAPLSGAEPAPAGEPQATTRWAPPVGGYALLAVGGALTAGSVISWVLRASSLATLNRDCKPEVAGTQLCPQSRAGEVDDARSAAQIEGPLGIGLGLGAAAAVGAGIWMIVSAPQRPSAHAGVNLRVSPMLVAHGGGLLLSESL